MCRNIQALFNIEPAATEEDIHMAVLRATVSLSTEKITDMAIEEKRK